MRRLIFFLAMLGSIFISLYVVLFAERGIVAGFEDLKNIFGEVADGSLFDKGFNGNTIPTYAMLGFLLFSAVLVVILALMFLINRGALSRVRQFYTVSIWFLMGVLAYTFGVGYSLFERSKATNTDVMDLIREDIKNELMEAINSVEALSGCGIDDISKIPLEIPKDPKMGEFATTIALSLAKPAKTNPRALADEIVSHISSKIGYSNKEKTGSSLYVDKVEVAGPGFINFRLNSRWISTHNFYMFLS